MIIYDIQQKGKNRLEICIYKFFIPLLIIMVGVGAFGIGKLINIESKRESISIEYATSTQEIPQQTQQNPQNKIQLHTGMYVAARGGTSYYLPWCKGAKRISEKNKVWFTTKEIAKSAGYKPATNCKGMK